MHNFLLPDETGSMWCLSRCRRLKLVILLNNLTLCIAGQTITYWGLKISGRLGINREAVKKKLIITTNKQLVFSLGLVCSETVEICENHKPCIYILEIRKYSDDIIINGLFLVGSETILSGGVNA
ncbi:hypothetical protein RF11_06915 [Thelohanellus kitauei]|uniref:Uncharacterized protein n=1 Tax=Thelohanellus kitauei TaxID=669202 RepID=A0A0C2N3L4_THEKT|nr:hypothetical protein RF11_06915 [Thelohanellus kitauei]